MAANGKLNGLSSYESSSIARFYDNKSIFITGATGFVGKVLVEKLLSSCPGLNKIYILLRRKKDVSPEKRLEQLKQTPIFDYVKKHYPQRMDKIVAISGDVLEPDLGISQENKNTLISNVSIVFHSAATVKFDEALRLSVTMNVIGTRSLLNLSRKMSKLEAFVHVSTAYCNCNLDFIEEKIYPPPGNISNLIKCIDCLDDDVLDEITPRLIGDRPNTYTFTKSMAENMLTDYADLPVVIIRPSIVTAALKWPMPGWVDNLNGPTGLLAGAGKGVLRSLYCKRNMYGDLIPVDICINAIIVAAWNTARERSAEIKVYHVTSGDCNPIKWGQIEKWSKEKILANPFDDVLWYPGGSFKSSKILDSICITIFHMFPAYIIDFATMFFKSKSKMSMVNVQRRIRKAVNALEYFTTHQWTFESKNLRQLHSKLNETDKNLFNIDVSQIQWVPYMESYVKGIRRYILKEKEENIPKAKQHLQRMYYVHCFTKALVMMIFLRCILGNSEILRKMIYGFVNYTLQFLSTFSNAITQ